MDPAVSSGRPAQCFCLVFVPVLSYIPVISKIQGSRGFSRRRSLGRAPEGVPTGAHFRSRSVDLRKAKPLND